MPVTPSDLWIYYAHTGFWGAFGLGWLARSASRGKPPDGSAPRAQREDVAPHSRALIFVHGIGFMALYMGIGRALFGGHSGELFRGQPIAGAIVIAAGGLIMCWALLYFRSWRFRAKLDAGHELATGGPFRFLRHPIYMGFNLLALGSALWLPTPVLWVAFVVMFAGSDLRARGEETLLLRTFGEAYATYCKHTRRFLPGVY